MKILDNVYAEVSLDNLIHNLNLSRGIDHKRVIGVVKDDAYGHGSIAIAKTLIENGVEVLAVGSISEGVLLRDAGIKVPILILGITPIDYCGELLEYDLTQTIPSYEYAILMNGKLANLHKPLKVHIKIETGMGRVGLIASDENLKIVNNIFRNPLFDVQGVYSHLSDACNNDKTYTINQYKLFNTFCNNIEKFKLNIKYKHICNSAGSLNYKFDNIDYIRPGLLLYGYNLCNDQYREFKPIMTLKAKIVHIKKVHKGEFIGYDRTYKTDRESIIATLNVGYGYGYPRYLSNRGRVILKGQFANIIGNICMDHCMIDITHIDNVKLFDEVILIGRDGEKMIDAGEIASYGSTICYEVLCGIRRKISRIYLEKDKVKYIREGRL